MKIDKIKFEIFFYMAMMCIGFFVLGFFLSEIVDDYQESKQNCADFPVTYFVPTSEGLIKYNLTLPDYYIEQDVCISKSVVDEIVNRIYEDFYYY